MVAQAGSASFAGASTFRPTARQRHSVRPQFQGAGSVSISMRERLGAFVRFAGAGKLSPFGTQPRQQISARFVGAGSFSARSPFRLLITARFVGAGGMLPDAAPISFERPVWPSTITTVPTDILTDGYSITPLDEVLRTDMDQGPPRLRRRFSRLLYKADFDIAMLPAEFALFKGFYSGTLNQGTYEFLFPVFNGFDSRMTRVRFLQPYSATDFEPIEDDGSSWTRVQFSLLLLDLQ